MMRLTSILGRMALLGLAIGMIAATALGQAVTAEKIYQAADV